MMILVMFLFYLSAFLFVFAFVPMKEEVRPTLETMGFGPAGENKPKERFFKKLSFFNRPLCKGALGRRISRDLNLAYVNIGAEEFLLMKQMLIIASILFLVALAPPDWKIFSIFLGLFIGYYYPEFWLKSKIKKIKAAIIKELPDVVDLLALCVNAGLDFMMSLKWVVEKSPGSVMVDQLNMVMQEINVGKTRRDALRDLSRRYKLRDLSTFTRTLIQADKMGTSMTEALNNLSIDMRYARFRRGEAIALKAPLKILFPLLFFIFPVVGILVAGPIVLKFMEENPFADVSVKNELIISPQDTSQV